MEKPQTTGQALYRKHLTHDTVTELSEGTDIDSVSVTEFKAWLNILSYHIRNYPPKIDLFLIKKFVSIHT